MIKKIKSKNGETLVETLVATLVVTLSLTMLAGSIVSAANVNASAKKLDTDFKVANTSIDGEVTIKHLDGNSTTVNVDVYQTNDKYNYIYYKTK